MAVAYELDSVWSANLETQSFQRVVHQRRQNLLVFRPLRFLRHHILCYIKQRGPKFDVAVAACVFAINSDLLHIYIVIFSFVF